MDEELEEIREEKLQSLKENATGERDEQDGENGQNAEDGTAAPDRPVHVDGGDHLQDLTAEHDVVLVDFYADWCGPCKMLAPIVETLAAETAAAVAKVDVDVHQALAGQYQVRGVPTIVLFADGEPVERFTGVRGEDELRTLIEGYA